MPLRTWGVVDEASVRGDDVDHDLRALDDVGGDAALGVGDQRVELGARIGSRPEPVRSNLPIRERCE